jgi:glycosyltransferase involved in cell wall biosynthesis
MSEMAVDVPGARFVQAPPGLSLGELRNLSVLEADGEFVCQWDDDDWYHPRRLQRQLAHLLANPLADGCVLGRWLMHWPARNAAAICGEADMAGSLLAYKAKMVKYYPRGKGEDNAIYAMRLVRLLEPWLYTYNIHGDNTYDAEHFENLFLAGGVDLRTK